MGIIAYGEISASTNNCQFLSLNAFSDIDTVMPVFQSVAASARTAGQDMTIRIKGYCNIDDIPSTYKKITGEICVHPENSDNAGTTYDKILIEEHMYDDDWNEIESTKTELTGKRAFDKANNEGISMLKDILVATSQHDFTALKTKYKTCSETDLTTSHKHQSPDIAEKIALKQQLKNKNKPERDSIDDVTNVSEPTGTKDHDSVSL